MLPLMSEHTLSEDKAAGAAPTFPPYPTATGGKG